MRASREFERGRRTRAELDQLTVRGEGIVTALEERLGLSWVTGGHLGVHDLFRPLVDSTEGMMTGPLTRWYETNTFYRRPVAEAPPRLNVRKLAYHLPSASGKASVILPGPWTFARLTEDRRTGAPHDLEAQLVSVLEGAIVALRNAGFAQFILHEPELVVRPPAGPAAEQLLREYSGLRAALGKSSGLVWTYFGNAGPVLPLLARLPVDGVGVDLSETRPSDLRSWTASQELGLGCLDARTSLPENPEDIAKIARELLSRLSPRGLVLGPGVPLDLLPETAAIRKLEVLGKARMLLGGHPA